MNKARLVSYSQEMPAQFDDERDKRKSLQELVEYCAKVSNPKAQEKKTNLIKYLVDHKHWSPFETVSACIEVETTRDIARQLLRHRSFSFQEFSQRYANVAENLNFTAREARLQDNKNRQNSLQTDDDVLKSIWNKRQNELLQHSLDAYKWAIENDIAKEQARSVLPEGMTNSRLYVNGTLRSWIHYIELRTTPGTQLEHMELARECANVLQPVFPMINEFVMS